MSNTNIKMSTFKVNLGSCQEFAAWFLPCSECQGTRLGCHGFNYLLSHLDKAPTAESNVLKAGCVPW